MRRDPLPGLGPEKRDGALPVPVIDRGLAGALGASAAPGLTRLLQAALYLWHDHLDASHRIAQEIETADGSLIHGMMHRREPDYGNAKYWFRRAAAHPSFLALAVKAEEVLKRAGESDLRSRLLPNNTWDAFAFVDAVEDALDGQFQSKIPLLEELQRIEMECLIENLLHRG
jgi:hypothetical protein